jgi:hypothetical protein
MKKKRRHNQDRYVVKLHLDPASPAIDLIAVADALVLLHGNSALDAALKLAHNINTAEHEFEAERQLLKARADDLRAHLAEIEAQPRSARKP